MESYVPPNVPGPIASRYDLVRYRWRLARYSSKTLTRPTIYEAIGIFLGVVGALSAIGIVLNALFNLDGVLIIGIAILSAMLVVSLTYYHLTRTPRLFRVAARNPEAADSLRRDMGIGMDNVYAFRAIERIYVPIISCVNAKLHQQGIRRSFKLIQSSTRKCPFLAAVLPAMAGERLDEILSREWKERPHEWEVTNSTFAAERQAYMSRLRSLPQYRGPQGDDEDGDNLVLDHLTIDPTSERLKLHPAIATYGQIVRSCDALLNEFAVFGYLGRDLTAELSWLGRVGQAKLLRSLRIGRPIDLRPVHALRLLPWRNAVHRWAERPEHLFLAPRKRAAGLGVAVTMLKQDSDHPTAFVARRSSVVGTYPDVLHVVPAGMCNAKDDLRADRRPIRNDFLRWTMIGELLEECYDVEELADYRTEDWVAHVSEECAVRSVSTTAPIFTGLAFDFLNLRPEICSRVDVVDPDDKAMQREHFKLCWEYSRRHGVTEFELSRVVDLCDGTDFVQSGIASLALARISVDNETGER